MGSICFYFFIFFKYFFPLLSFRFHAADEVDLHVRQRSIRSHVKTAHRVSRCTAAPVCVLIVLEVLVAVVQSI